VALLHGSWSLTRIDDADVRLRTGNIGMMKVDVRTPIRSGSLSITGGHATLHLVLALDQLRTGNFLTEGAARSFITGYKAHDLVYEGKGAAKSQPFSIEGQARAGTLDLSIGLQVSLLGGSEPTEVELEGSAAFGRVHIPLPGVGTVDNMVVDIDAKLGLA
jgi:hypothetical protein